MSQKPTPVVSFVPDASHLKINADYKRVWRVEYRWKTELRGWQDATPFVFALPYTSTNPTNSAFILAAARCPHGAIGIELTAVKISTPLTNKPD